MPGFLKPVGECTTPWFWNELYNYAGLISFGVSFGVYLALVSMVQKPLTKRTPYF